MGIHLQCRTKPSNRCPCQRRSTKVAKVAGRADSILSHFYSLSLSSLNHPFGCMQGHSELKKQNNTLPMCVSLSGWYFYVWLLYHINMPSHTHTHIHTANAGQRTGTGKVRVGDFTIAAGATRGLFPSSRLVSSALCDCFCVLVCVCVDFFSFCYPVRSCTLKQRRVEQQTAKQHNSNLCTNSPALEGKHCNVICSHLFRANENCF